MNVCEFLETLSQLYELDKNIKDFKIRVERYTKILTGLEKDKNKNIDYENSLDNIVKNYPYRVYPNFTEILKNLVYFPKEISPLEEDVQTYEPRNFKITAPNGMVYEFAEVPNSWSGVHSITDFKDCKIEEVIDEVYKDESGKEQYETILRPIVL